MVSGIIRSVSFILSDENHVTYTMDDLLDALNNACRVVVICRPDACYKIGVVKLQKGIQQHLPDSAIRLMESYYNASGQPILMIDRKELDRGDPIWSKREAQDYVSELMYDERFPSVFYVNPPSNEGVEITLGYSVMPDIVKKKDDSFPLPEKYIPVVIEWMLYQLFSLDAKSIQSQQKAMMHNQQFYNILQVKLQGDRMMAPSTSIDKKPEQ